ncbi:hypothetical protein DYB32_000451 [Aphanomyces invadans]|uniref:Uncharacterized protein n=1 Tax=Aphanomyces invadans TaxID=157072 RepID=A0A3R6W4I0_9STRA|nr:hypothetical protein DYB32_000451 [Aphanomyces invadans]
MSPCTDPGTTSPTSPICPAGSTHTSLSSTTSGASPPTSPRWRTSTAILTTTWTFRTLRRWRTWSWTSRTTTMTRQCMVGSFQTWTSTRRSRRRCRLIFGTSS